MANLFPTANNIMTVPLDNLKQNTPCLLYTSWNELVDNAGKLGITTEGYGLYNIDELETEVQKSASLKNLQESADEYGLKYSKNASESSMQKLVGAYEDEHFQKDYVDKNTKAIEKTTRCV